MYTRVHYLHVYTYIHIYIIFMCIYIYTYIPCHRCCPPEEMESEGTPGRSSSGTIFLVPSVLFVTYAREVFPTLVQRMG